MRIARGIPLVFLAYLPVVAHAETFNDRVALARQAEDDTSVNFYQKTMFDKVGRDLATFMSDCWDEAQSAQPRKFILVGDISPSGQAVDIEVQPGTDRPQCFAKAVSTLVFPAPPPFRGRAGFPIFFDVAVK